MVAVDGAKTGFMVDGVSEVMKIPDGAIRPAPEVSTEQMRLIGRVANLDALDRMILLVDPAQLLDRIEADVLAKFGRDRFRTGIEGFVIKLLIADDSALMRKLLEGIFRDEGDFDIQLARNGAEALDLVRSFDPHVVTLDVQMPGMDGLSCLSQIMIQAPRPVVMVSSLTAEGADATLEAIELGAVDFIAKPGGTVSLEIDRLRPVLVEKVRGAVKAKIRPTLRLKERIRHQFRGAGVLSRTDSSGSARTPPGGHAVGAGAGPDRDFDRWPGRPRCGAAAVAEATAMAGDGCTAYAGEFHGGLRQTA